MDLLRRVRLLTARMSTSSSRSSDWSLSIATGKERWKLPLGPFNMFYGFGASPILVDDKVILPVDQDNPASYLIAVDKNTGTCALES